jgi:hypothetical protein
MPEQIFRYGTIEQARNAAIQWLETHSVAFGPDRKIEIGRLGVLAGREVGVSSSNGPFWRIRLDYDPQKQAHFNVEYGAGATRQKAAFCFMGGENLIRTLAASREPRR